MNRRLALLCLGFLLVAPATRAFGASMEREFSFDPNRLVVTERGGITDVKYRGALPELREGRPDLPWLGELVELPAGVRVKGVRVLSIETAPLRQQARIASAIIGKPGLAPIERSVANPEFFGGRPQPESAVELGVQGWMRGRNMVGLSLAPVRWNPATGLLERVTRVRVSLITEALGAADGAPVPRLRVVPEWEDAPVAGLAKDAVVEHEASRDPKTGAPQTFAATQIPSILGSPVQYVIITNDEMVPEFQRLADWKTASGVPAVVRTLSFIRQQYPAGSDDAERIRYFIRDAYSRWGTKWVLLGGDTEVLPERLAFSTYYVPGGEMIASDMYYSCLDGNWNGDGDHLYGEGKIGLNGDFADILPEVWVGRAPAINLTEAKRFVDKTLQYITQPAGNYENQVLFFAEVLFPQNWTPGMVPDLDGADMAEDVLPSLHTKPWIHYARLYENHTDPNYEPGALQETRAVVRDSLNRGYNVAVHIGHGFRNVMSVGDDNLTNSDAMSLTNGTKLTNLYATNCTSNAIDFPCIGEAFLHAPNGGAVTNIGSSRFDFPVAGRSVQEEYFRLVYEADVTAVGEAQGKQKLPFIVGAASDGMTRWTLFTLLMLGDPELRIYTSIPKILTVSHPASMALNATTVSVNVSVAGTPLAGARVTAYKANDEYSIGMTDGAGNVTLPVRPDNLGAMKLTVTAFNGKPYQGTINVTAAVALPVLDDQTVVIDDNNVGGTSGDGNGVIDAGEVVDLIIPLRNTGTAQAPAVNATLSTTDGMVSITIPNASYNNIDPGVTANPVAGFRVSIPYTTPDQREIPFRLDWSDGAAHSSFETVQLVVSAPVVRQYTHTIADAGGNTNGIVDAGETITLLANLKNRGTGTAYTVTAKLRSYDGLATVTDSTASYGDLSPGEENPGDALVFVPSSTSAKLELRISDSYGLITTQTIDVVRPADATGLAGRGFETSITLNWTKSGAADLFGYNVYRSLSGGGPFTRITQIPTERTAYYLDAGLTPLTAYFYQISSVDTSGNETTRSATLEVRTTPPNHGIFPIPMGQNTPSSVALDPIYSGYPMTIVVGADVLYAWHPDGTAPVDADGAGATSGDFTTRGIYYAAGPSIADLDGDNYKEIIGPNWDYSDTSRIFVFDRDGNVKPGWPAAVSDSIWGSAAIGDVDNDGKKEMFFGTFGRNFYGLRWNGTEVRDGDANPSTQGVFKVLPSEFNFGTPAIADLDKDGKLDIIYGTFDARLEAWRFDGTNVPGFPIVFPGQTITGSAAVGYLDGPGDIDLDVVIGTGSYTWPGTTDSLYCFRSNGQRRWAVPAIGSKSSHSTSPAIADMNNDGFDDVVYASTDGKIYVFNRNGVGVAPVHGARYSAITLGATESSPVVADIDGDGFEDVVIGDELGTLTAISGSTGTALPGFPIQTTAEVKGTPGVCDCDGDGMTEIVVAGWDRNMYMWDYDYPFSPGRDPSWPQFHHDAMRTGLATNKPFLLDVDEPQTGPAPVAVEFAAPSPNPAARTTRVWYAVPAERAGAKLDLSVFDLTGRRVQRVAGGAAKAGRHSAEWNLRGQDGAPVGAGVYFMKLTLGSETRSQKLVVLH